MEPTTLQYLVPVGAACLAGVAAMSERKPVPPRLLGWTCHGRQQGVCGRVHRTYHAAHQHCTRGQHPVAVIARHNDQDGRVVIRSLEQHLEEEEQCRETWS